MSDLTFLMFNCKLRLRVPSKLALKYLSMCLAQSPAQSMCLINVSYHNLFNQYLFHTYHLNRDGIIFCYVREILMLHTIETGVCENFER